MKIAYLILAHKNPAHLARLISRLNDSSVLFYVHIDKKSNIQDFFNQTDSMDAEIVYANKREDGRWGGFGLVQATLNLIELAITENPDYFVLLSGMDYPVKSEKEILRFLKKNDKKSFIEYSSLPHHELDYNGLNRTECYSYDFLKKRHTFIPYRFRPAFNIKGHIINLFLGVVSLFKGKRTPPDNISVFYYGSQWWVLHLNQMNYIVDFLKNNPSYVIFHKHTLIPDELFFQTILCNQDEQTLFSEKQNCHFLLWDQDRNHPLFLDNSHMNQIKKSEALFARKFHENSPVLDMIDNMIMEKK
jgi:hypothetical protein